jgi:hypothetical protein
MTETPTKPLAGAYQTSVTTEQRFSGLLAAFGINPDDPRQKRREVRYAERKARSDQYPLKYGELRCDECWLPIDGSVTLIKDYRRHTKSLCLLCSLRTPSNRGFYRRGAPIEEGRIRRRRCKQCGRIMRLIWSDADHCCDACKAKTYNESRPVTREPMLCEVCGIEFIPPRSDAKTCSNRCRQAAHRARHPR